MRISDLKIGDVFTIKAIWGRLENVLIKETKLKDNQVTMIVDYISYNRKSADKYWLKDKSNHKVTFQNIEINKGINFLPQIKEE